MGELEEEARLAHARLADDRHDLTVAVTGPFQGLMEGLYLNADPEMHSMMRMYEFFDIDGIAILDMFDSSQPRRQTAELVESSSSRAV